MDGRGSTPNKGKGKGKRNGRRRSRGSGPTTGLETPEAYRPRKNGREGDRPPSVEQTQKDLQRKRRGTNRKEGEIRMSIYMDDRTVVTNKRGLLIWAMEEWHRWSAKVGLRENLRNKR